MNGKLLIAYYEDAVLNAQVCTSSVLNLDSGSFSKMLGV